MSPLVCVNAKKLAAQLLPISLKSIQLANGRLDEISDEVLPEPKQIRCLSVCALVGTNGYRVRNQLFLLVEQEMRNRFAVRSWIIRIRRP